MKLIAIVGPTASGKSELAVFLAKQIKKAEIISADSRQVYKYLDIGTNKVSGTWQTCGSPTSAQVHVPAIASKRTCFIYKGIPHYCIDFVHPRKTFTVVEFAQCAKQAIQEIQKHGNIPILAGGTGFYIQAVVDDIVLPEVMPDVKLRKKLEKIPVEKLFKMLEGLDPRRAEAIDSKNPRRLIRAIEIITATGMPIPSVKKRKHNALMLGIAKNKEELRHAIEQRVKKQMRGLINETKLLIKMKIPKKRIRELGFEYRLAFEYMRKSDFRNIEERLVQENLKYAKRQTTWFKRDKRIHWVETKKDALALIRAYL